MLSMHPMFATGLLLLAGYLIGKVAVRIGLPHVSGYILAGLLVGESVTGIFPSTMNESFRILTEVALGLIALTIGAEFSLGKLRRIGRASLIITLVQLVTTLAAVSLALMLFGMDSPFALLLAVVATATAPAAIVAVVQSLRARGRFIDYLYSAVALSDAGCVIIFGLVFAFTAHRFGAQAAGGGRIALAFGEVLLSLLLGITGGLLLHAMTRRLQSNNEIMIVSLGTVMLFTGLAIVTRLSPLLSNMAIGAVLVNLSARNHRLFRILEPLTPPLYALFFVIAGTELKLDVLFRTEILLLGAVYIVARSIGKYIGVWLGCAASGLGPPIRANLGWCMLPQAGVAIGLVLLIQSVPMTQTVSAEQQAIVHTMVNIVLLSVLFNELIGPPLARMAIVRGNRMEAER